MSLLSSLPADFPASILIVQHIHPKFTPILIRRLSEVSAFPVKEAENGETLKGSLAYVAPGDHHMEVERRDGGGVVIRLHQRPPLHGVRPSADLLFSSVSEAFLEKAVAVILTGMGQDGLVGAQAVKRQGGTVLAEAKESCVIYGMPRVVVEAQVADRVVPLKDMAGEILKIVKR
ncbi:MAG: chemotaxis protein CheB [candidate division NC10 bacterium]|nr:chemotaxis protein CheB [candidate division NC10 bacterium]